VFSMGLSLQCALECPLIIGTIGARISKMDVGPSDGALKFFYGSNKRLEVIRIHKNL